MRSGTNKVSVAEARDRLVKALNHQKPDKKHPFVFNAIPLQDVWNEKTAQEAKEKSCEAVLTTRLIGIETSEAPSMQGAGADFLPVFRASVEFQLLRAADAIAFATDSVKGEDQSSLQDAVWHAVAQVASRAAPEFARAGDVPRPAQANVSELLAPKEIDVPSIGENACAWLASNIPHAAAVAGVCQYAITLPRTMPNFICEQQVSRYRGNNSVPFDLVSATIRYEDGMESYSAVKVNGVAADAAIATIPGLWSTGQFGGDLRSIFDLRNQAVFEFAFENLWQGRPVWVFNYTIVKQNDPLWRLRGGDGVLAPPYKGELWVDETTGGLLRFGSVATNIPQTFPMEAAALQIDYANVAFGDGSTFVLPADFTVTTSYRGQKATRNVVEFRNCQKFRAKSRMVLNVPMTAGNAAVGPDAGSEQALARERAEGEQMYAVLREQAVREDDVRAAAEARSEQEAVTVATTSKVAALEKRREEQPRAVPVARSAPSAAPEPPSTVLKVSVQLVPVTVVVRDARGHSVGGMRKQDFELLDNGKPQPITSFSLEAAATAAEPDNANPSPGAPTSAAITTTPAMRNVAYVFDDLHAAFGDLVQARDAAQRHLNALRPSDRAAIFATSGAVGLDFTDDRAVLRAALDQLRVHTNSVNRCPPMSLYMADLIANHSDLDALSMATADANNCAFGGMRDDKRAERLAKTTAFEMISASSAEMQATLGVLRDALRRTEAAPGSRSIVLVSPGFMALGPETRQAIMELIDHAIRAEVTIHTLDIRGLYTVGVAGNATHASNPEIRLGFDRDEAMAQGEPLAELADGTGGTYFHNNNDANEGFRRTADAPQYMYVLGFSPPKLDGKFHKLKVKLLASNKLAVQARQGYFASNPATH